MGLVILAGVFLLPFSAVTASLGSPAAQQNSLYATFTALYGGLGQVQASGDVPTITLTYIVLVATILLIIAGLVGIFPLGTGVLGIVGMALVTVGPYMVIPGYTFNASNFGVGFYMLWIASIIALAASFWHGKGGKGAMQQQVVVQQAPPTSMASSQPQQAAPSVVVNPTFNVSQGQAPSGTWQRNENTASMRACPNCGSQNPSTATFCKACGSNLG